jgi:hypothetical protein
MPREVALSLAADLLAMHDREQGLSQTLFGQFNRSPRAPAPHPPRLEGIVYS